ncbi:MAG: Ppx/GppA family phosphatase [Verrucomicrobiota bacterium]|nr:Ppx/GppA family phosphatase [Verrucomicrobiota bacterium]
MTCYLSPMLGAVIDVGTNSVKLLVADFSGNKIKPLLEESKQTRLGRGFYQTHLLQPSAIEKTTEAVAHFAQIAKKQGATFIRVIATSAARDAKNPDDLINAIEKKSTLRVEIISGEQEADWVFRGVITNPELAQHPLLILDVGGGSSEFILGEKGHQYFRRSFKIGTVRLLEQFPHSDPPTDAELAHCHQWLKKFLKKEIAPDLEPALASCCDEKIQLVGTGGTATILARIQKQLDDFDREQIEATLLTRAEIHTLAQRLWSLPLAQRKEIIGLPKKRADVILAGAVIYEAVVEQFGFSELRISTRGLRYAALMEKTAKL